MDIDESGLYESQVNFLEDFLGFHPDALETMSSSDKTALSEYFALCDTPGDVFQHRKRVTEQDPNLERAAIAALRALLLSQKVEGASRLLPPSCD